MSAASPEVLASDHPGPGVGGARRRWAAGLFAVLAVVAVRALVPPRFPAVDGTLVVHAVTDPTPDRQESLAAAGLGGWPRDGSAWVVASARWATDGAVPARREDCRVVVLVRSPEGAAPRAWHSASGPAPRQPEAARPLLERYGEVLPAEVVRQAGRGQGVFAVRAAERGDLSVAWLLERDAPAYRTPDAAARQVRVFLAPVCPDGHREVVHGLVELDPLP